MSPFLGSMHRYGGNKRNQVKMDVCESHSSWHSCQVLKLQHCKWFVENARSKVCVFTPSEASMWSGKSSCSNSSGRKCFQIFCINSTNLHSTSRLISFVFRCDVSVRASFLTSRNSSVVSCIQIQTAWISMYTIAEKSATVFNWLLWPCYLLINLFILVMHINRF